MVYQGTRSATGQDRRAALLAAIQTATMSDGWCCVASLQSFDGLLEVDPGSAKPAFIGCARHPKRQVRQTWSG